MFWRKKNNGSDSTRFRQYPLTLLTTTTRDLELTMIRPLKE